jgi:YVTN family beta-propeller protein
LPNGWRVTPAGKAIATMGDLVTNIAVSPDGKVMAAINSGFLPHGLDLIDVATHQRLQHIPLSSTWLGLVWSADGKKLFVSGGNASGAKVQGDQTAPVYEFAYADGRLQEEPAGRFVETIDPTQVWWSGVAYLPGRNLLYAANRGTGREPSNVVVFDAATRRIVTRIQVGITPYQILPSADGTRLFVSNMSSGSVSVIDTASNKVIRTIAVGSNPNDMKLSADGRLFVACSNDNLVDVIDTRTLAVTERVSTTLTPRAPEGSTPDALAIDTARHLLYVANADNNSLAVVNIQTVGRSSVAGFIPTGWYPSALALADRGGTLFIGNAKGEEGHPDPLGPHSPLTAKDAAFSSSNGSAGADNPSGIFSMGKGSVHTLQTSSIEVLAVADLKAQLPQWTRAVVENTPYHDSLLSEAMPTRAASVIPATVGAGSPIKHVIYIIKENRTYDQVFGDLPGANGDPRLTIFGEKVTPNLHALAKEYVTFDNLYCDGEVSADGHSWSTAAYATDFLEKQWPALYGGHSKAEYTTPAYRPQAGFIWDIARAKGLTYRDYAEMVRKVKTRGGFEMVPEIGKDGLAGHVSPDFVNGIEVKDSEKMQTFLREFRGYEANFESKDPRRRLPNLTVMSLPGDHTSGTRAGKRTPVAMVADNDEAIGQLVEAVSHSRYWPETAIFIIEDDAQDGADHVDARRTEGLVISPYVKRGIVDSTLYSTSSMLRSMELLLGLPAMSQYDAAAMPMYAAFGATPVVVPYAAIRPMVDLDAHNRPDAPGARESARMDLSAPDRAPMRALNEVIWQSVKGNGAVMPAPVHRFRPLVEVSDADDDDDDRRPATHRTPKRGG